MAEVLQQVSWVASSIGILATGCSAYLAYRSLNRQQKIVKADHDRSKRAFAVKLLLKWNNNTLVHRRAIEKAFPGLLDHKHGDYTQLTKKHATEIYNATNNESELFELRFHIIELLNFFEAVAMAYENSVADQEILETSFKGTLNNYYIALHDFLAIVEDCRQYQPWKPYITLVRRWNPNLPPLRPPPDDVCR